MNLLPNCPHCGHEVTVGLQFNRAHEMVRAVGCWFYFCPTKPQFEEPFVAQVDTVSGKWIEYVAGVKSKGKGKGKK